MDIVVDIVVAIIHVATGSHMSDTVTLLAPVWSLLLVNTSGIQATEAETQLIPEAA